MLFPTLGFLLFFLVVACASAALERNFAATKLFLVAASYYFYAQWDWRFCFLLAFSSSVSYTAGRLIGSLGDRTARTWVLWIAIGIHLSILIFFKYYNFLIEQATDLVGGIGVAAQLPYLDIILPVGISFFTFHGISYVVDVWRGDVAVCRRFTDMLLYLSFFPQLVAGPIVRAAYFLPQLDRPAPAGSIPTGPALVLIVSGLFKKVVIANELATLLVDPVFQDPARFGALDRLAAAYGYAVQIYCDFSAYSDIAIGIAALLGFRFPRNFDQPYRSVRLREFWRRWHISLSSWLRDYLYKPLGGNRAGRWRAARNLFITMLLGGIWHGAALKFAFWGMLYGIGQSVERELEPWIGREPRSFAARLLSWVVVFHFVCLAWVFFRADSFAVAWTFLGTPPGIAVQQLRPFSFCLIVLSLAAQFLPRGMTDRMADGLARWPVWGQGLAAGLGVAAVEALGPDGVAPFIYFQF